jgi:hypothetical protein
MPKAKNKIYFRGIVVLGSLFVLLTVAFVFRKIEQAKADSFLPSDFNQDGIVDAKDIDLIKQNYANMAGGIVNPSPYDPNNDHKINSLDLAIVEDNQGNGTNPDRDWDKDGWSVGEGDCNDRDRSINPIAEEKADSIDNNCRDGIDELVTYKPLITNEYFKVLLSWTRNNGDETARVTGVEAGNYGESKATYQGFGKYRLDIYDNQNQRVDFVSFDLPSQPISEGVDVPTINQGTMEVLLPKNANTVKAEMVDPQDNKTNIDLTQGISKLVSTATAATDNGCHGVGSSQSEHNTVYLCDFSTLTDSEIGVVANVYNKITSKYPVLNYLPLKKLFVGRGSVIDHECGSESGGCTGGADDIYIPYSSPTQFEEVLVHELGHVINDNVRVFSGIKLGTVNAKPETYKVYADFARFVTLYGCKQSDPSCHFDAAQIYGAWQGRPQNLCVDHIVFCPKELGFPEWQGNYRTNPVTGESDPRGPRPTFGMSDPYGLSNLHEGWAVTMVELYLSTVNQDRLLWDSRQWNPYAKYDVYAYSGTSLVGKNSPYQPSTYDMTKKFALFGKNGFIRYDVDHDGVPDDFDNCSPQEYPGKCPIPSDPNATNACSNSDQGDYNHNNMGDKCEFPGENMWTACLPDGGICPSPAGERMAYNSPNTPRWPVNGLNPILDYCSTAAPVYTGGSDHELTPQEICPSPEQK